MRFHLREKNLLRKNRERLQNPYVLSLKRNRRRADIVHRRGETSRRRGDYDLYAVSARSESVVQRFIKTVRLENEVHSEQRQQQSSESAVQHIVRARREPPDFLHEKRGGHRPHAYIAFRVGVSFLFAAGSLRSHRGGFDKAL